MQLPSTAKYAVLVPYLRERLGYVCNPRSLMEGTETSRRRTDELGSRLERPIYFECKLNEPMHIGMQLLHPAATDHSVSISRRQVQCIFRFSLRSRAGIRPLWYRVVQEPWRWDVTSLFPPSGNEGYIHNRDVPYQSVTLDVTSRRHVGGPTNWDPYQKATDTASSSVPWRRPVPLFFGAG